METSLLKSRVATGSVLALSFVLLLVFGSWSLFAAVVGVAFTIGAWEWANLSGITKASLRIAYALVSASLGLGVFWWLQQTTHSNALHYFLLFSAGWWAIALLWVQGYPASAVLWQSCFIRALMGWMVLIPAWVSLIVLRQSEHGMWTVFFIIVIVSSADIGAYFAGRQFGKRKLAPTVSPGKSWEGVWGGMTAALILGSLMVFFHDNFVFTPWVLFLILPTAMISVVGDLLESMLKRFRGIKDSGSVLPGHGGILDRIDGLVAAAPIFTLVYLSSNAKFSLPL